MEIPKKQMDEYIVIDWVDVKSGMIHSYDYMETEDNFIKEIYFYPSLRIDGASDKKDLVALSYMNKEDLNDFDYADTMAKFKILKLMKEAGIRGARNGRDQNNPEKYKHYAVKIHPRKREIRKLCLDHYDDKKNISFDYSTINEMHKGLRRSTDYCAKLNRQISKR